MPVSREDMERIIASVPGFRVRWEAFLKESEGEPSPPYYLAMGELAHYIVDDYARGSIEEFPGVVFHR